MIGVPGGTISSSKPQDETGSAGGFSRSKLWRYLLLFLAVSLIFFLLSSRIVNVFDEGILLTGTMRTMAGQILHRDFYYNYGPAQLYILAALFKLFGTSVLVERLAEVFASSCLVVSMYALARKFCARAVAIAAVIACMLWMIGEIMMQSLMNPILCLLTLWTCWLILPLDDSLDDRDLQRRHAFLAGLLAGVMVIFRYDMGIGLLAANVLAIAIIAWLRRSVPGSSLRSVAAMMWPYPVGAAIIVVPAAIAYLSVAPLYDLLYDVVIYNAKYYRVGRGLPFPGIHFGPTFEDVVVYLLPVLIGLSFYAAAHWLLQRRRSSPTMPSMVPDWVNLLIALGVASAIMYLKGLVRVSAGQMYGSTIPCVLLAAVLYEHRKRLHVPLRAVLAATLALFFLTAGSATKNKLFQNRHLTPLNVRWLVSSARRDRRPPYNTWCATQSPITKGFCFLLDSDHIQTTQYVDAHTRPSDTLYVGLPHHDRIFVNDNITYFAAQRLPATRWTQFDPFLENRADIQRQMIADLERNKPPYIALDAGFESAREPNGSSVSTGVHLLDDYIASHYTLVKTFGQMTILQRNPS